MPSKTPSTPLRVHRLRDVPSSTGSPPPPPLRHGNAAARAAREHLVLPLALLVAESLGLLSAASTSLSRAATSACSGAVSARSILVLADPLLSTTTRACASAFSAAGAASAAVEASRRLALAASSSLADMLLPLAFVVRQIAAAARLAGVLLTYLGWTGLWLLQACRLVVYSLLLMPGFARVGLFYFTSKRVARGVRYGPRPRNTADLYVPPGCGFSAAELAEVATAAVARAAALLEAEEAEAASKDKRKKKNSNPSPEIPALFASSPSSPPRPVVVYVTGGAWLIGHRAWGSLLAARLSAASGAVVLCLDYRNFPQAGAGVAAEDVGAGIGWAVAAFDVLSGAKREQNGGEKKRGKEKTQRSGAGVVVVGQSAGAHLSALAILARCAAAEGVALPCVSSNEAAVARMMSAAAAAGGSPKASPSPGTGGSGSSSSSSSASSRSASVDVEVDATENSVVILSAPPHSRPGSSSLASPREPAKPSAPSAAPSPPPLQRHNSLLGPLGLPSLADAAATLGACGPPSFGFGGGGGRFSFPAPPLDPPEWVVSSRAGAGDVAAFVGVSGVYDVASLAPHLARRGLRPRLLERIMSLPVGVSSSATCPSPVSTSTATANGGGGEKAAATRSTASWRPALAELSPTVLLLDCLRKQREDEDASAYLSASPFTPLTYWPSRLPPTALLHGTADACAPASDAARFVEAARAAGAQEVSLRLYDGETHTSPLIENPMRGRGRDALGADLAELVVVAAAAAAAARTTKREGNGGGDGNGDENKRRRNAAPSSGAAPSAHATSATLLRTSSSAAGIPAPKAMHKKERLGAVDGGGALCPAPLIAAAAAVCPF